MKSLKVSFATNQSWTDDLDTCSNTGIGFSINQVYREDGQPQNEHCYEDCSCHKKFKHNSYWYAIYDGHEGGKIAKFCLDRMTAELCFAQLNDELTDDAIKEVLRQAFISMEREYMESIGSLLAERTSLTEDINGLTSLEACQKFPEALEKLKYINFELSSGTACAVALIFNNKLYVANVGNCRVLLCQTDENNVLKVVQLSVDHDLKNEDELLRLSQIGIDVNSLKNRPYLGNQSNTRCLGNYLVKGGYKEFEDLSSAIQEPVTAEPDIHGGFSLDESCKFLLMMSSGLLEVIEEAVKTDQINKYIAHCVVEQFREQTTLTGVAQAVVDKIVRLHHDCYMSNPSTLKKREDITLMLRNFNFPLHSDTRYSTFDSIISNSLSHPYSDQQTIVNSMNSMNNISSTSSSEPTNNQHQNGLDPDQKIKAYVDFVEFKISLDKAQREGRCPASLENS
ncbi:hypothetical protein WA026_017685 [Henosepilachna vigintioctopunctata]|uniref:PPM-type phosphatase domain-containing protein n=1 Tax=Henosepilachna vigintioctopunctata TaxID=420089 RepID=A0AAW1U9M5_9CUCU